METSSIETGLGQEADVMPQDPEPPPQPLEAGSSNTPTSRLKRTKGAADPKKCSICAADKQKASSPLVAIRGTNTESKCTWSRGLDAKCDRCESYRYNCSEGSQISNNGDRQRRKLSYAKCEYCRRDRKKVCFENRALIMKLSDQCP
jgi:hypothetical protein